VLELAARTQLLLIGELHGTREVPRLVASLLVKLGEIGYQGLGLEVPHELRPALIGWADGRATEPPSFFRQPSRDGRGSIEVLQLVKDARALHMDVLCFDQSADQPARTWADRDRWMARNLLQQWSTLSAGTRVIAICGSLHARLAPERGLGGLLRHAASGGEQHWPSLAGWIRQWQPALAVSCVEVHFGGGAFYNMGERSIYPRPGASSQPSLEPGDTSASVKLWLPRASVATFLAPPT
jgi:hypothetical protein